MFSPEMFFLCAVLCSDGTGCQKTRWVQLLSDSLNVSSNLVLEGVSSRKLKLSQRNHKIKWIRFLAITRKFSHVELCINTLCWPICSINCIWEKDYVPLLAGTFDALRAMKRSKESEDKTGGNLSHHTSIHAKSASTPGFTPLINSISQRNHSLCQWMLPGETWQSGRCIHFLYIQ